MKFYDGFLGHELDPIFNSRGHRCRELEDINLRKYILFAGDNVGVGWDKPIEETYPHLVSTKLNIDYYNLSIFNGGLDAIKYNLLTWFNTVNTLPKAVILSTEFVNSFLVADKNYEFIKACDLSQENVKIILDAGNTTGFFDGRLAMVDKLMLNSISVPIYQIVFKNKIPLLTSNVHDINYEGDLQDHFSIADAIVNEFNKIGRSIKP